MMLVMLHWCQRRIVNWQIYGLIILYMYEGYVGCDDDNDDVDDEGLTGVHTLQLTVCRCGVQNLCLKNDHCKTRSLTFQIMRIYKC